MHFRRIQTLVLLPMLMLCSLVIEASCTGNAYRLTPVREWLFHQAK